ncbi:MAG TPA: exopolysaccharide biosynthesis protein [Alphaproteobacteria bacterium]
MSDPSLPSPVSAKRSRLTRAFLQVKRIAQTRDNHVRFETLLNLFGQDGLLVMNTILALLNIILSPLQGISMPLGFLQMMICIALLRDQKTFWMPRRWRSHAFPKNTIINNTERWLPVLYRLESISHPRLEKTMRRAVIRRFSLWCLLLLAFIVALPIPFMNITPSIAVLLISFGLLNYDGLMWILGLLAILAHSGLYFAWGWFYPHLAAWFQQWFSWLL